MVFGVGPTLLPGGSLSLAAGRIKSRAGVSNSVSPTPFNVLAAQTSTRPGPISLKGPDTIDTCSDLQVALIVDSHFLMCTTFGSGSSKELGVCRE